MENKIKTRFKGHETFYFREGWLSKALFIMDNTRDFPMFSNTSSSIAKLGVGANMVKSIKYWLITSGLVKYETKEKKYKLTPLGVIVARQDVYLEDVFTLWILHINIVRNFDNATTWNLFFNEFHADKFEADDVKISLKNYLINNGIDFAEKSLIADINVLLNMYTKGNDSFDAEENIVCPLSQLNMFKTFKGEYQRMIPNLDDLNELVILYAIVLIADGRKDISISELETGKNSLGYLFNVNRVVINEYLDMLANQGYIRIEKTAGLDMVYLKKEMNDEKIVEIYFQRRVVL